MHSFTEIYIFYSIWSSFSEHSRITGFQVRMKVISLTQLYHFHPLHRYLARRLLQRALLQTEPVVGIEPETLGFQAQIANQIFYWRLP